MRLWVEIPSRALITFRTGGQPPCEAVSWNVHIPKQRVCWDTSASLWGCELKCSNTIRNTGTTKCQPPCEAVSWNTVLHLEWKWLTGQPPCEAVSWNVAQATTALQVGVSLLVRLWVEMPRNFPDNLRLSSASLWGCELKCCPGGRWTAADRQPPCEAVSWNFPADCCC